MLREGGESQGRQQSRAEEQSEHCRFLGGQPPLPGASLTLSFLAEPAHSSGGLGTRALPIRAAAGGLTLHGTRFPLLLLRPPVPLGEGELQHPPPTQSPGALGTKVTLPSGLRQGAPRRRGVVTAWTPPPTLWASQGGLRLTDSGRCVWGHQASGGLWWGSCGPWRGLGAIGLAGDPWWEEASFPHKDSLRVCRQGPGLPSRSLAGGERDDEAPG